MILMRLYIYLPHLLPWQSMRFLAAKNAYEICPGWERMHCKEIIRILVPLEHTSRRVGGRVCKVEWWNDVVFQCTVCTFRASRVPLSWCIFIVFFATFWVDDDFRMHSIKHNFRLHSLRSQLNECYEKWHRMLIVAGGKKHTFRRNWSGWVRCG